MRGVYSEGIQSGLGVWLKMAKELEQIEECCRVSLTPSLDDSRSEIDGDSDHGGERKQVGKEE